MDEVDFTILAATSVFTDLIEKCPPAEACRDAFDRTAKATIKMANSTGGFGQVLRPTQAQGRKRPNSYGSGGVGDHATWSARSDAVPSDRSGTRQHHHQQQRASADHDSKHQIPQYDMAAASPDTYSSSTGSSTKLGPPQQKPPKRFRPSNTVDQDNTSSFLRHQHRQPHSTTSSNDTLSPDATFDPALGPSPSQQSGNPLAGSGSSPSIPTTFYETLTNHNTLFADSNLQGLDFLQSLPGNSLDADFGGAGAGPGPDGAQVDLNFGLGWEGMHHDFSDGQQLDLFDGFFFGDQRGAGGGAGMGFGMGLDQGPGGTKEEGEGEGGGQGQ